MVSNRATDQRPPAFIVEDAVVEDYDLGPYAGWLYVVICKHINRKKNDAFPGVPTLAKLAGIAEGILIAILFQVDVLPHLDRAAFHFRPFVLHYGAVWLAVYLTSWMVMRLLFPRWRFRGGEWMGKWRRA